MIHVTDVNQRWYKKDTENFTKQIQNMLAVQVRIQSQTKML